MKMLKTTLALFMFPVLTLTPVSSAFGDDFSVPPVARQLSCPNCRMRPPGSGSVAQPQPYRVMKRATNSANSQANHQPIRSMSEIFPPDAQKSTAQISHSSLAMSQEESALLARTNAERTRVHLSGLIADPSLMKMAREHCESMARLQQLSHTIEGRSFSVRLTGSGYRSATAGENVAEGQTDSIEAVQDWMTSPGHRANLMNGEFTHIGIAVSESKSGRKYYTQVFGRPLQSPNASRLRSF